MQFQRLDRKDPEKVFGIFYSAAGVSKDAAVCLGLTSTADGITVVQPTTAGLKAFVGIVNSDIAATSYGLVQIYGYRASSNVLIDVSSTDTDASTSYAASYPSGTPLIVANTKDYLVSTSGGGNYVVVLESVSSATASHTASTKIHIRAM